MIIFFTSWFFHFFWFHIIHVSILMYHVFFYKICSGKWIFRENFHSVNWRFFDFDWKFSWSTFKEATTARKISSWNTNFVKNLYKLLANCWLDIWFWNFELFKRICDNFFGFRKISNLAGSPWKTEKVTKGDIQSRLRCNFSSQTKSALKKSKENSLFQIRWRENEKNSFLE